MEIKELKAKREKLWKRLDGILKEMEPYKVKERAFRKEIKEIQERLYALEMGE